MPTFPYYGILKTEMPALGPTIHPTLKKPGADWLRNWQLLSSPVEQRPAKAKKSCKHGGRRKSAQLADLLSRYSKSKKNNDRFEIGRGDSKHTNVTLENPPAAYVFHPSHLLPSAAEKRTGFLPPKPDEDVGFGAFADLPTAARRAAVLKRDLGGNATLYLVHPTPNMVPDPDFGGYFVVAGIRYDQVIGSISLPDDLSYEYLGMLEAGLKMESPYDEAFYSKNKAYKPEKYDGYTFTDDVPLGSLKSREAAKAFMKTKGAAVDWHGDFPLFQPPRDSLSEWLKPAAPDTKPWLRGQGRVGL
ncbi:hypothetical protein L249_2812 [Ophiocordyceps polyrhachis-furcata BCC 54312]|uniref:Uncharacterized protein n=1 Tax=Ophiocordyceps polyrhachis-furcata BCC 54312 TaxID=1330021 RepID=A0A367LRW4_9HYPO|nr:hypothetical protein L249_2812 [Ophiocordyceps polyrhachis-furcata BCC 54312]